MLVLSRKPNEVIRIGDDIVVTVVEIGRGQVRLAIDAPRNVKILRQELLCRAPRLAIPSAPTEATR